ncbi:MAG: hypothetical protein Ta2A_13400 [Treponemataceae bacterium]|nr:MAG: hypothetical protein Ta2A_13400 [Treponemataceae bacterium]
MNKLDKTVCTGCQACIHICPVGALRVGHDEFGNIKPECAEDICISCGKCEEICPVAHPVFKNRKEPDCYACMADDETRYESSSGGVFPLLARYIIGLGGTVCGAAWTADFGVEHVPVNKEDQLPLLYRSKYMQSDVGNVYPQIESLLKQHKPVLFCSTPCQVAGLYAYLGTDYPALYTVDLLCTQAPSQDFFKRYLNETFEVNRIDHYDFRIKNFGWTHCCCCCCCYKEGNEFFVKSPEEDIYQMAYHSRLMMSTWCENCVFRTFPRQGDLTIGDFWWIWVRDPSLHDVKGTSVVLSNNKKGDELVKNIFAKAKQAKKTPLEWLTGNAITPYMPPHPARDRFYSLSKKYTFKKAVDDALAKKYDVVMVGIWAMENYGSQITNYALYQVLRDMGKEVLMVERPADSPWKPNLESLGFKNNPYNSLDLAPLYPDAESLRELNASSDVFLVGSDQLFHADCYLGFSKYNDLSWVNDNKTKSVYALSFGQEYFRAFNPLQTPDTRSHLGYFLRKFDNISMREKSGVTLAKDVFGIDSDFVLDPVFLCNKEHFERMAQCGESDSKDKICVYMLDSEEWKEKCLQKISEDLSLGYSLFIDKYFLTPEERVGMYNENWIRAIAESKFVVTDSFHGMCFSIIFKKPFVVLANVRRGLTRFESLVSLFHLEDRCIQKFEDLEKILPRLHSIDYDAVYQILEKERNRSVELLKKAVTPKIKLYSDYDILGQNLRKLEQRDRELEQSLRELQGERDALRASFLYRLWRKLTWAPRKIRGFFRSLKQHGLIYTMKLFVKKILRKIGVMR